MFNHLIFLKNSFPIFTPFSLSCVCSAGLCSQAWSCSLASGRHHEPGVWPLLLLERQQKAFRPFNSGVQGVFSPAASSQPGFPQVLFALSPLMHHLCHHTTLELPWTSAHSWSPSFPKSEGRHNQILSFPLTDQSL